jgi:cytochrome c oxidase subunit IV
MTQARQQENQGTQEHRQHERKMYLTFGAMIATSTVTMFLLTYTNAFTWSHMTFSEERVYMALLMGSVMAVIMLGFMSTMMYKNRKVNIAIVVAAVLVGGAALGLSRSQALVQDGGYMKGMIPHHSIAILTSERAEIDDVRVRELADGITEAQRKEIAEMKWLLRDIEENGKATTDEEARQRPVPDF